MPAAKLELCRYQTEEDYWRLRAFVREAFAQPGQLQRCWPLYRFDYWRWHAVPNVERYPLADVLFIWEAPDGQVAAAMNPEGKGEVFLHVSAAWHTPELEEEMLAVAEERLALPTSDGRRKLRVWAHQCDAARRSILERRGYVRSDGPEYQRWRSLAGPIPEAPPPAGYTVRALGDGLELLERCYASGLAFHAGDITCALENREDTGWYRSIQNAPLYRRDLDLVAIAPDGAVAGFATVWFDDVARVGAFEPVGTPPAYRRRGLGTALMCEGLRRLKRLGANLALVGSYAAEAGALYESVGFTAYDLLMPWAKDLPGPQSAGVGGAEDSAPALPSLHAAREDPVAGGG
jgi:GNAT superfamily N-acetyltransferase